MGLFNLYERKRVKLHIMNGLQNTWSNSLKLNLRHPKRIERLENLEDYMLQEEFPINSKYSAKTPFFRDESGTNCAVAHLMQQDNHEAFIQEVQKTDNNIYVNDITHPLFEEWMEDTQLQMPELAKIQPEYFRPPIFYTGDLRFLYLLHLLYIFIMIAFRMVTIKFTKFKFKHPGMGRFPLLLLLGVHILYIQLFYNYMHQANPSYTGVTMFFAITLAMIAFLISIFSYAGAPSRRILSKIINTMMILTLFGLLQILFLPDINNCLGSYRRVCFQIGYMGLSVIDYLFPIIFLAFWVTLPIMRKKERESSVMETEFNMKKSKI